MRGSNCLRDVFVKSKSKELHIGYTIQVLKQEKIEKKNAR